jgi:hypothetical protein
MIVTVPVKGYFEENCFFYIDDRTKHGFVIDPVRNLSSLCGPPITVENVEYLDDGDRISLLADQKRALKVICAPGAHVSNGIIRTLRRRELQYTEQDND